MVERTYLSHYLTRDQCKSVFEVGVFAYCCDRPFNQFVSIHLRLAEVVEAHTFLSRLLKLFGDWLRRNTNDSASWLWILENPPWSEKVMGGLNAHIYFHVPYDLIGKFQTRMDKWIGLSGGRPKRGVRRIRSVWFSRPGDNQERYLREGLLGSLCYGMKGIDPKYVGDFEIVPKYQGIICGKRWGHAECLGQQYRWLPDYSRHPHFTIGPTSIRRRFVRSVCRELLEFPLYREDDWPFQASQKPAQTI